MPSRRHLVPPVLLPPLGCSCAQTGPGVARRAVLWCRLECKCLTVVPRWGELRHAMQGGGWADTGVGHREAARRRCAPPRRTRVVQAKLQYPVRPFDSAARLGTARLPGGGSSCWRGCCSHGHGQTDTEDTTRDGSAGTGWRDGRRGRGGSGPSEGPEQPEGFCQLLLQNRPEQRLPPPATSDTCCLVIDGHPTGHPGGGPQLPQRKTRKQQQHGTKKKSTTRWLI